MDCNREAPAAPETPSKVLGVPRPSSTGVPPSPPGAPSGRKVASAAALGISDKAAATREATIATRASRKAAARAASWAQFACNSERSRLVALLRRGHGLARALAPSLA
eukprot:7197079-Heterocapsa_arctica.AAC.1